MTTFVVQQAVSYRLDEIYTYTESRWGKAQADKYLKGLFNHFERIASQNAFSYPVPAELEVDGYFSRYEKHFVYWKLLESGRTGIVTVLHERMHQLPRFQEDTRS